MWASIVTELSNHHSIRVRSWQLIDKHCELERTVFTETRSVDLRDTFDHPYSCIPEELSFILEVKSSDSATFLLFQRKAKNCKERGLLGLQGIRGWPSSQEENVSQKYTLSSPIRRSESKKQARPNYAEWKDTVIRFLLIGREKRRRYETCFIWYRMWLRQSSDFIRMKGHIF